jgi:CheY-like chemotaxis protein
MKRLRVMVVDDEPFIRTSVAMMLTLEGHCVETAADGEAGLHLAQQQRPDVILTDLRMGRLDGLGLLAAVRSNPALAHTRVVLLTGEAAPAIAAAGAPQADARLTKPFTRAQLLMALGLPSG